MGTKNSRRPFAKIDSKGKKREKRLFKPSFVWSRGIAEGETYRTNHPHLPQNLERKDAAGRRVGGEKKMFENVL